VIARIRGPKDFYVAPSRKLICILGGTRKHVNQCAVDNMEIQHYSFIIIDVLSMNFFFMCVIYQFARVSCLGSMQERGHLTHSLNVHE